MQFPQNQDYDALIIGGGIIGLSIARELRKNGVERIGLIEKHSKLGTEASSAAAGMLAPQAETDKADDFFRLCSQSRDLYPNFAAELLEETGVDIELDQTGTLYLAFDEDDLAELEKRFEWQSAAGLQVEKLDEWEIAALEPNVSRFAVGALRFPNDWQTENKKIIQALIKSLPKRKSPPLNSDSSIAGTIKNLIFDDGRVSGAQTEFGNFRAPFVIVAAGAWTSLLDLPESFASQIQITPVRGQILSLRGGDLLRHVIYSPRGYVVPRRNQRILVGATVENVGFDGQTTSAAVVSLLETAFEIAPQLQKLSVRKIWSGLRPKTPDGLPLLGEFPANSGLYFATGHYRNGILLAPLTARLLADKICKNVDSPFLSVFNPSRFTEN